MYVYARSRAVLRYIASCLDAANLLGNVWRFRRPRRAAFLFSVSAGGEFVSRIFAPFAAPGEYRVSWFFWEIGKVLFEIRFLCFRVL